MAVEVDALWQAYRNTSNHELRQKLITLYLPLVRMAAGRLRVKLPPHLDREDLASFGLFGLFDAIEKYDPARGVKFETYASQRIRGAILDELRQASWAPRSVTDKLRRVNQAYARLEQEFGPDVPDELVAKEAGISPEELGELWAQTNYLTTLSLEEFLLGGDAENSPQMSEAIADDSSPDPEAAYTEKELREALALAVESLPEKDRLVLSLYYHEGLTLKEIGRVLEVSESRVCQLHARALARLRQKLLDFG